MSKYPIYTWDSRLEMDAEGHIWHVRGTTLGKAGLTSDWNYYARASRDNLNVCLVTCGGVPVFS